MTPTERLLDHLDGVRRVGEGRWMAQCPAHQDRRPSLSIREGDDGRVLVYDFGGCPVEDIVSAVGLDITDLFPPREALVGEYDHRAWRRRPAPAIPARDALGILDQEAFVVLLMARRLRDCGLLTDEEIADVALAGDRIEAILLAWSAAA